MATAFLTYTTPASHELPATQIARFGTSQVFEPDVANVGVFEDLMGLPTVPTSDNTTIAGGTVTRTITYNLALPALATFVSRFPTDAAQKSALQGLFTRRLEALCGCPVSAGTVAIA